MTMRLIVDALLAVKRSDRLDCPGASGWAVEAYVL